MSDIITLEIPQTIRIRYDDLSCFLYPHVSLGGSSYIAGGAARKLYADTLGHKCNNVSDLDIYSIDQNFIQKYQPYAIKEKGFNTPETFMRLNKLAQAAGFTITQIHTNYPVQYRSLKTLFDTFDFEVCKFATDFYNIYTTKQAIYDYENKLLRATSSPNSHSQCLFRIAKYLDKGFHPTASLLSERLETVEEVVDPTGIVKGYGKNS